MQDMTISGRLIGLGLWVIGSIVVGLSFFFGPGELAAVGVMIAMAGQVIQVRCFICDLSAREREAFEYGRESVRSLR